MPTTHEVYRQFVVPTYSRFPQSFVRGEGVWIWDENGNRYLDCGAGIAVCSLGHSHPALTAALQRQVGTLMHCSNLYHSPQQALLAKRIVEEVVRTPGKVFFCNSGAEANEALYKLARAFGHRRPQRGGAARTEIITFENSFHGRTLAGIAATAQAKVRTGFAPLTPGFKHCPYNDPKALKRTIGPKTAAILLEMVQGEGGINPASPAFLRAISDLCRERDLLLLVDEIQAGLGRTGHLCSWESILGDLEAIEPDAVSWAKGLGGGFPIGAVWVRNRALEPGSPDADALCDVLGPGSHGTTFGGTPLAATAALVVIDELLSKGLPTNAIETGEYLRQSILAWKHPAIRKVRGLGLMLGIVLDEGWVEARRGFAEAGVTPAVFVVSWLNSGGLLTIPAGRGVVRLLPALNISRDEANSALEIARTTLDKLVAA